MPSQKIKHSRQTQKNSRPIGSRIPSRPIGSRIPSRPSMRNVNQQTTQSERVRQYNNHKSRKKSGIKHESITDQDNQQLSKAFVAPRQSYLPYLPNLPGPKSLVPKSLDELNILPWKSCHKPAASKPSTTIYVDNVVGDNIIGICAHCRKLVEDDATCIDRISKSRILEERTNGMYWHPECFMFVITNMVTHIKNKTINESQEKKIQKQFKARGLQKWYNKHMKRMLPNKSVYLD